jgi:hypothetical protein
VLLGHALGRSEGGLAREAGGSGVMMIPIPRAGVLRSVRGLEEARSVSGVDELRLTIPLGARLVPLPEGGQYLGFIFARDTSPERVEQSLRDAHGRLTFEIEMPAPAGKESIET